MLHGILQEGMAFYTFSFEYSAEVLLMFAEAKERVLRRKICLSCSARNPWNVPNGTCRKCGSSKFRPKKMGKKLK